MLRTQQGLADGLAYTHTSSAPPLDTFMQRTKRLYADSRTATSALEAQQAANAASAADATGGTKDNLGRLNEDLQDVTRIMTKNMEDLLWRGDSLDQMSSMSSSLRDESLKYRKAARQINFDAMIRKWAPCVCCQRGEGGRQRGDGGTRQANVTDMLVGLCHPPSCCPCFISVGAIGFLFFFIIWIKFF